MPSLDALLEQYDLKTLESAVEKRRRREERQLAQLVDKRRKLETKVRDLERRLKRATSGTGLKRKPNARRLNDISLAEALEKVMNRRKSPIHYRDLTEAVVERGIYQTRSRNLLSTVAVTLKRDRRFKKVAPGMYILR